MCAPSTFAARCAWRRDMGSLKRKPRDGVDRSERSPLHHAAIDGEVESLAKCIANKMDVNLADDKGWTALHFAAQNGSAGIVRLLLTAGAGVDPRNDIGNTPLFVAVFNSRGHGEIIGLLRAHGADPMAENARGVSPLKLARTIANFDVGQFFSDLPEDSD